MAKKEMLPEDPTENETPAQKALRQEALQINWLLQGDLKNVQLTYLRVARRLADFRDRKLYLAIKHKDIESYADEHLSLQRASLYRYLRVYDWVKANRPQWLKPHPKGFIPELTDLVDLAKIEKELAKKGLAPEREKALKELRDKALDGKLLEGELDSLQRRRSNMRELGLRAVLSSLRAVRKRAANLASMPQQVIAYLDSAIGFLDNHLSQNVAGVEMVDDMVNA